MGSTQLDVPPGPRPCSSATGTRTTGGCIGQLSGTCEEFSDTMLTFTLTDGVVGGVGADNPLINASRAPDLGPGGHAATAVWAVTVLGAGDGRLLIIFGGSSVDVTRHVGIVWPREPADLGRVSAVAPNMLGD